ncbi:MAG: hypothetical protein ACK54M_17630 [Pseudanabaena sp.]
MQFLYKHGSPAYQATHALGLGLRKDGRREAPPVLTYLAQTF